MMKVYRLHEHKGIDSLSLETENIPKPGRGQVLVRIKACSLNYRDLMVVIGKYPPPLAQDTIPCSDGAGEVVEIGADVYRFKVGDRVCGLFHQAWNGGGLKKEYLAHTLGGSVHGTLAEYCLFDQDGLVHFPSHLSFEEAATLPCAAVTAWNSLFEHRPLKAGETVLVLGTGGVSSFGLQFAVAAGARVIATSSSDEKLAKFKELGATDVINYKKYPDWEKEVKRLTNGRGVDHVIEIGGSGTLPRSIKSACTGGQIYVIGFLAGNESSENLGQYILWGSVSLHGILVGSRDTFESMNRAIEHHKIRPIIDKVFEFDKAKEAFEYMQSAAHVGKIVIRVG